MLKSLWGLIIDGCWHQFGDWKSGPQDFVQKRKCQKCDKVDFRNVGWPQRGRKKPGGYKPEKPNSLPKASETPPPPTGKSGESNS